MKTWQVLSFTFCATVIGALNAAAQEPLVRWFSLDGGFETVASPGLKVKSVLGQPMAGQSIQGTLRVASGFLADTLLRGTITGVVDNPTVPRRFILEQNYPNPFNPTSTIRYIIPDNAHVSLKLFDLLGREVATFVDEDQVAGQYSVQFNATRLSSGVYFYRLVAGPLTEQRKLMVLK